MSNSSDVNEQSGSPRDSRNPAINSGLSVGSPVNVVVKQTSHLALEGSNLGDYRDQESADFSTDAFKSQRGPRGETGNTGA